MRPYWQRNQDSKAWLRRWEEKRRRAFDGGQIDHSKDKSAPWSHPAHYGYLVPLTGAALEAYKGWKIRTGNTETSDAVRWAFESIIKSMAAIAYDMLFCFLISLMQKCQCRTDRKLRIDGSTKKLFLLKECITEILVVTAV